MEFLNHSLEAMKGLPRNVSEVFGTISFVSAEVGIVLFAVFLASLVIYAITGYLGPGLFGTDPWRRQFQEKGPPLPNSFNANAFGYDRMLDPAITQLTASVTGALQREA